jgi:hypothetical protein
MSILHRRREVRARNLDRAAGGKRKPVAAEFPRASKTAPLPADVKARTWIDPEAPPAAVVAPARKKAARRK